MNGRIAKKLRKMAFGDNATVARGRKYTGKNYQANVQAPNGRAIKVINTTIRCTEPRATYLRLKNDYIKTNSR